MTLIWKHAPNEEKDEVVNEEFCSSLEKVCDAVRNHDMKTVLGDFNAKAGKECCLYPVCWGHSL